jgi:hypothetical protein
MSMGYVENNLLPNEQVTYRARLHWVIYCLPMAVFAIAILVVALGGGPIAGGAIAVVGAVLLLQKIEGIGVDQGLLGRIFGDGTITVAGVGGTLGNRGRLHQQQPAKCLAVLTAGFFCRRHEQRPCLRPGLRVREVVVNHPNLAALEPADPLAACGPSAIPIRC